MEQGRRTNDVSGKVHVLSFVSFENLVHRHEVTLQVEFNFLLNPFHANFGKIKITNKQAFNVGHRLKQ